MKFLNLILILSILIIPICAEETFTRNGIGGGGGIFNPSISPYDSNLRLTTSDMGGVFVTNNGGNHWKLLNFNQLSNMHNTLSPVYFENKIYWNKDSNLYLSEDKGNTWSKLNNLPWPSSDIINEIIAVDKEGTLLVVTNKKSYIYDGSWKNLDLNIGKLVSFEQVIYGFDKSSKNMFISRDKGNSWEEIKNSVFKNYQILSLTGGKKNDNLSLFVSVKNLGILRSQDEGKTWKLMHYNFDELTNLQMAHNQIKVICGFQDSNSKHDVWCSYDSGKTWKRVFNLIGSRLNVQRSWMQEDLKWWYYITNKGFHISKSDSNKMYITTQGELFHSADAGKTWQIAHANMIDKDFKFSKSNGLEVTSIWDYYIAPFNNNIHYIAYTDIGFAKSVDAGKTWKNSVKGSPWRNTFYDIEFDKDNENIMYAAASSKHDIPYWTAVSPPSSNVNYGGVLISNNKGDSWSVLGSGLPNRPVTDILLLYEKDDNKKRIFATVYGQGVYKYSFETNRWTKKSDGLGLSGNMHVLRIEKSPSTDRLYALITAIRSGSNFYQQGGLWKSDDDGESWQHISSSQAFYWPTNFEVHPTNDNIIYMTAATAPRKPMGGLFKTQDGGNSWNKILEDSIMGDMSGTGLSYDHTMEVYLHPNNLDIIYVGSTSHGLFMSKDGGDNWEHIKEFPFKTITKIKHYPLNSKELIISTLGAGVFFGPDFTN